MTHETHSEGRHDEDSAVSETFRRRAPASLA